MFHRETHRFAPGPAARAARPGITRASGRDNIASRPDRTGVTSVASTLWGAGSLDGGMSQTTELEQSGRSGAGRQRVANQKPAGQVDASPAELLELLDAEYTQEILEATGREARSARELAERCGASRPTVYRRLNSLQEVGLVDTEMEYDADGHHRALFEATLEAVSVDVTGDGLSVTVTTTTPDEPPTRTLRRGSRS